MGHFFYQDDNIDSIGEVITGYIHFFVDTVVPKKTIKIYPNDKEYITCEIKQYIRWRNQAFNNNNNMEFREIQRELRKKIEGSKRATQFMC